MPTSITPAPAHTGSDGMTIALEKLVAPLIDRSRSQGQIARSADSLGKLGQLNEIVVTPQPDGTGFLVVCGFTRVLAARSLGWSSLRARVVSGEDAVKLTQFAVADNTARNNLNLADAVSQAVLLKKVSSESDGEVAKMLGISAGTMSRYLRMAFLEPPIQEAMRDGRLTFDDAYALATLSTPAERMAQFEALLSGAIRRGSLKAKVTRPRRATATTFRIGPVTLKADAEQEPYTVAKETVRTITETLAAFKATTRPKEEFLAWLTEREARHG